MCDIKFSAFLWVSPNKRIGVPNITVIVDGATDVNTDGSYDIRSGTSFNITCMLSCPTATITWTQNGSIIDASNGFTIVNNGDITQSVLTRNMAGVGDTGRYQCSTTVQTIQSNDTADVFVYSELNRFVNIIGACTHPLLTLSCVMV